MEALLRTVGGNVRDEDIGPKSMILPNEIARTIPFTQRLLGRAVHPTAETLAKARSLHNLRECQKWPGSKRNTAISFQKLDLAVLAWGSSASKAVMTSRDLAAA